MGQLLAQIARCAAAEAAEVSGAIVDVVALSKLLARAKDLAEVPAQGRGDEGRGMEEGRGGERVQGKWPCVCVRPNALT